MRLGQTTCERCGQASVGSICSWFSTEQICFDCSDAEKRHPRYPAARLAEEIACKRGDFNFPGIGWEPSKGPSK